MARTPMSFWLALALSIWPTAVSADEPIVTPPIPSKQWRAAIRLGSDLVFDAQQLVVTAGISADLYLKPLFDDHAVALALLPFVQHPSSINVSAGKDIDAGGG